MQLLENELMKELSALGLDNASSKNIIKHLSQDLINSPPLDCWERIQRFLPEKPNAFPTHRVVYKLIFPDYHLFPSPCWKPTETEVKDSNLEKLRKKINITNEKIKSEEIKSNDDKIKHYADLYQWSLENYPDFWRAMTETLNIIFDQPYTSIVNLDQGFETPKWFVEAKMNIVNSCFTADPKSIAIVSQNESGPIFSVTYEELDILSNRIANSLTQHFKRNDRFAIIMPMNISAVAIYLGIIKAGMVVVSIADSFSADEIKTRLRISNAKGVFTQDIISRDEKIIPLYNRIIESEAPLAIVINEHSQLESNTGHKPSLIKLRSQDILWSTFLSENKEFTPVTCDPEEHINILFSSGTTGDPKAIPWTHCTPIKSSSDAHLHHNLKPGDVFSWYTNLGWMMGPWLIFSTLMNHATLALYQGTPSGKEFGEFVQNAKVTHLGVVPTLVKSWRMSGCMETLDWNSIKLFTSTGECSNPDDMLYLMYLAKYRPIIEYCGGTEIGGAYITGTIVQPSAPAAFTTATLGLGFVILDEKGHLSDNGEIALIPPSIGLSTELLNKDHHSVYYQDMPEFQGRPLRRHGDEASRYPNGFYRLHGRSDDTMNLGGIKVSSAEIERTINTHPSLFETAAIAIEPEGGGPAELVIYAVSKNKNPQQNQDRTQAQSIKPIQSEQFLFKENKEKIKSDLQKLIKQHLNPLFKIQDVIMVDSLPRTASNKIMRRILRNEYQKLKKEISEDL